MSICSNTSPSTMHTRKPPYCLHSFNLLLEISKQKKVSIASWSNQGFGETWTHQPLGQATLAVFSDSSPTTTIIFSTSSFLKFMKGGNQRRFFTPPLHQTSWDTEWIVDINHPWSFKKVSHGSKLFSSYRMISTSMEILWQSKHDWFQCRKMNSWLLGI